MSNKINIKRITLIDPNYSGGRVEVGFEYFKNYFSSKNDFLKFLEKLNPETKEKFLYSIHFYWNHNVFRICDKMSKVRPMDIFIVIITFAIIENLMQNVKGSRMRIREFFRKNLKNQEIKKFKLQNHSDSKKDSVDVLYDARNDFIHRAQIFYFHNKNDGSFAEVNQINIRNGDSYLGIIKLSQEEYVKLFWKAFLRFFSYKI